MREIKFRGKRISDGEWVTGDLVSETDGSMEVKRTFIHLRLSPVEFTEDSLTSKIVLHEVDPKTVGQYTGLKDKNGKEVFEGDKLKYQQSFFDSEEITGFVCFHSKRCEFTLISQNVYKESGGDNIGGRCMEIACRAEIIGNIYESPSEVTP